jgi:hypothetical protein
MMKTIPRICMLGLLAVLVTVAPAHARAQSTNKPASDKKAALARKDDSKAEKQPSAHPFHGKLAAVDKTKKTIKVGESVYQLTPQTKINKAGKPVKLEDGVVGEPVSGYLKPNEDGKLVATTVNFGPKPDTKSARKKKDTAQNQ